MTTAARPKVLLWLLFLILLLFLIIIITIFIVFVVITVRGANFQNSIQVFQNNFDITLFIRSRESAVGLASRGRSSSQGRTKNFLFFTFSRPALGSTQPPVQCVPRALSAEVERQGREADHSPPASAEVKKIWIYTSTPPYAFMA
jgi:hypothetical protein